MLFSLFSSLFSVATAASYDPDLTWRTMHTEHFNIHFHGGEEQLAEEMATVVENVYDKMTKELDWEPKRATEVVLVDNTDSANGYAQYIPYNTIVIFVTAPESTSTLSHYEDWNDAIFTHEYTHILHLDTIEGLPAALRHVFGRVVAINGLAPGWVVEGQATMQETWHTPAGRGRATIPNMIKRTATLSDNFPPLGSMDGFQAANPSGNLRYLFGQDFMNYIAQEKGDQVWTEWNHNYGGGIPYWLPSNKTFGERLPSLYDGWKANMEARYAQEKAAIEAIGLTPYTLLTGEDQNCSSATFSPDGGKMVYSCYTLTEGSAVYIADSNGENIHQEIKGTYGRYFGWRNDGEAFAYSASRTVNRFNLYSDVYLHKIGGSTKSLTAGKRARDPEFRADGEQLLVVTNEVQNNQLATLTIDQRLNQRTQNTDHTQYSTPRYSPDGQWIAVSMWRDGQRDLWVLDAEGTPVIQLTNDKALDTDPRWSADGKHLYFTSDRTGTFNVFTIDLETAELFQVTNVLTGAFFPSISPDQQTLLFTIYQHYGYSIATMALNPEKWISHGIIKTSSIGPEQKIVKQEASLEENIPLVKPTQNETQGKENEDIFQPMSQNNEVLQADKTTQTQEQSAPKVRHQPNSSTFFLLPAQDIPLPTKKEWTTAEEEYQWWQFSQKRKAKQPQNTSQNRPTELDTQRIHYDGLTGIGSATNIWVQKGEYIGLPHQQANWGEFVTEGPNSGPDIQQPTNADSEKKEEQEFDFSHEVERYNTMRTLFPPRFIAPAIYQTSLGFLGLLSTSGTDTLRRHFYSGSVSYRTDSQFIGWSASYTNNKYIPILSVGAYANTIPYGAVYTYSGAPTEGGTWIPTIEQTEYRYWDRRISSYAQISYAKNAYHSYFGRWSLSHRSPWIQSGDGYSNAGLPSDAYRPYLPTRGVISGIGGGWRYVKGSSYAYSISPENTRLISVVGRIQSPYLGSYTLDDNDQRIPFSRVQVTGEVREYRALPWGTNHVLAFKLATGLSAGDTQRYGSFRLGGSFGESGYYTLPDEWRALRGFDPASVSGDGYYLSSLEYRLPLCRFDWGYQTYPLFLRYLSAATFVDVGTAFDDLSQVDQAPLVGVGAELRASMIVSWGMPFSVRTGYAFGVNGGVPIGSLNGFYAWLGSSF